MGHRLRITALLTGLALLGGLAWLNHEVYQVIPPPLLPPMDPAEGLVSLSAESCASCHVEIAREWAGSFHARATSDPLYVADLAHQGEPYYCDHCHAPLMEQRATVVNGLWAPWPKLLPRSEANPRHQPGLHGEGVTCVACHQRDGAMLGPHEAVGAPHPVKVTSELRDPEVCTGCHVLDVTLIGDLQRPIADTLAEWRAYRDLGGDRVCVDCHMPLVGERPIARGGPPRPSRSHALFGAFDADFVRAGLGVKVLRFDRTERGVEAEIELENRAGHRLPTAEPHRRVDVILEIRDSAGQALDSTRYLVQRLVDLETLTEPPDGDTTLAPLERRRIQLSISSPLPPEARLARVAVDFVIWDAEHPFVGEAGLPPDRLKHLIAEQALPLRPVGGQP